MIRYTPYAEIDENGVDKTPFEIYKEAVARCDDAKKRTLQAIETSVEEQYNEYGINYVSESVHDITNHSINNPEKYLLKSLYSSKAAIIKRVKNYFNNDLPNRVYLNSCPYCGLPGAGTTEHILPKEDYPEYAIHILNLIPCCNICNSGKGQKVKDDSGNPEFINFYYHDIESSEFLKSDLNFDSNGRPKFTFHLEFCPEFDSLLRHTIENHYRNLHLLVRYNSLADSKYADCEMSILAFASGGTDIVVALSNYKNIVEKSYGKNHYYSAMIRALATSTDYHNYILALV
ncbi:MAG: HNH endonuclease [Muribaculaceae bacterium]|nr:HNH endonuclease [Muribaculaceae bacterium]